MPTFTRDDLYDLVWSEPIRDIAKRFDLSDVGFKKMCAQADVPTPPRGYWAKRAAGKRVFQAPLGPRPPGVSNEITIGPGRRFRWPPDPAAELAEPPPVEPTFHETLESVEERVRKLLKTAPFVHLRALTRKSPSSFNGRPINVRSITGMNRSSILPFEQRRLKILNSLFCALANAGMRPSVGDKVGRYTVVRIGDTDVRFNLDHPKALGKTLERTVARSTFFASQSSIGRDPNARQPGLKPRARSSKGTSWR